jgi:hypothetical protein
MWTSYLFGTLYTLLPRRWPEKMHRGSEELLGPLSLLSGNGIFGVFGVMRAWYMHYFMMLAEKYVHYVDTTPDGKIYTQEE